jgi:hypothetical protein
MKSREALAAMNALHLHRPLAASVLPTLDGCLAWVGVYPLDLNLQATREFLRSQGQAIPLPTTPAYHIRRFEVERSLVEQEDTWLAERDLKNKASIFAYGDDDLVVKLGRLGVRLEELELPANSSYPI